MTLLICAVALVVRLAAIGLWQDHLVEDRDAYVGIAHQLADGNGLSDAFRHEPTAFRPPLYPVMLAAVFIAGGGPVTIGILQAVLGVITVWLVLRTAALLELNKAGQLAALMVAVDPLLLLYTTFAMTEVTMAALLALLIYLPVRFQNDPKCSTVLQGLLVGLAFGACALCRPSIWPFGLMVAGWWLIVRQKKQWSYVGAVVVGSAVLIGPWTIRNAIQIGKPVFTTTHGGYTLHLANNESFYRAVVQQPWGTTWSGEELAQWNRRSSDSMRAAGLIVGDEPAVDRWHRNQALNFIRTRPLSFVKGCVVRLLRFWSPVPNKADSSSRMAVFLVGAFYVLVLAGLVMFVVRRFPKRWAVGCGLLILSFSLVHSVFWSNARMRAPVVPAIALLSACGWLPPKRSRAYPGSNSAGEV